MDLKIERIDHLGVIAGVMKDVKLAEKIDAVLEPDKQTTVTYGEAVVGMVLNGLGFANRVISLMTQFFEQKPLDLLIRPGIKKDELNRHKLGRTLDAIHKYGCEKLFNEIALNICMQEEIDITKAHCDPTTFSVQGEYDDQDESAAVKITHGYSKAKRPDLKQIILDLCVSPDGGAPFMMKTFSGNEAETNIFHERLQALKIAAAQSNSRMVMIGDSKLYTEKNIRAIEKLGFISRVPSSINKEKFYVEKALKLNAWTDVEAGYKYQSFDVDLFDVQQRWVVFYSQKAYDRSKKTLDATIKKQTKLLEKEIAFLQRQDYACVKDAEKALHATMKKYKYYQVTNYEILSTERYATAGRQKTDAIKIVAGYKITINFEINQNLIEAELQHRACFILATNLLPTELLSPDILPEYKKQDYVEKGFAFMKTPSFFAESFFLKSTFRIQALIVIMVLALLIYTVAQRRLRKALALKNETIPNQIKKPTARPTLRWIFQLLEGIDRVTNRAVPGLVEKTFYGITDLRRKILSCFGECVMQIYGLNFDAAYDGS